MDGRISGADLDRIFANARTHSAWRDAPVPDALLQEVYEAMKWGPTSANCSPARILFLRTPEAKQRLLPALSAGNTDKTMSAPVVAIIGYDTKFYDQLPKLFPQTDARAWFAHSPEVADATARRNSALQGAYLMIAARALGLDCGPMSGFDQATVEREFFPDGQIKVNFLCNLGYGDASKLFPRNPRLSFDEACKLL
jgi:3-hydroxypropanoate dehydrogenase